MVSNPIRYPAIKPCISIKFEKAKNILKKERGQEHWSWVNIQKKKRNRNRKKEVNKEINKEARNEKEG